VDINTKSINELMCASYIYLNVLSVNILLSVYFQYHFILNKIKTFNGKIKLRHFEGDVLDKICILDMFVFIYGQNLR
ncbi:hypothetical protein Q6248_29850, partial [Klebsiella pneumoniae]|nr:hypothetical protein [Klebsiella pneumoniae]